MGEESKENKDGGSSKNADGLEEKLNGLLLFAIDIEQEWFGGEEVAHDSRGKGEEGEEGHGSQGAIRPFRHFGKVLDGGGYEGNIERGGQSVDERSFLHRNLRKAAPKK